MTALKDSPASLREMIETRLTSLSLRDRGFLGHASVQGRVFLANLVGATQRWSGREVANVLNRLRSRTGAFQSLKRGAYRFVHPFVREACRDLLSEDEQKEVHKRLAESLQAQSASPTLVGHHFYRAGDYVHAIEPLVKTSKAALEAGLVREASEALSRAEVAVAAVGDRCACRLRLAFLLVKAEVATQQQDPASCEAAATEAVELNCADPLDRAQALLLTAGARREQGRIESALEALELARQLYEQAGDARGVYRVLLGFGNVHFVRADLDQAHSALCDALAATSELGEIFSAQAEGNLGNVATARGRFSEAVGHYERAIGIFRRAKNTSGVCRCLQNAGLLGLHMDAPEAARKRLSEAAVLADDLGLEGIGANIAISEAQAAVLLKDVGGAVERLEAAAEVYRRIDHRLGLCECKKVEGMIDRERGDLSAARDAFAGLDSSRNIERCDHLAARIRLAG